MCVRAYMRACFTYVTSSLLKIGWKIKRNKASRQNSWRKAKHVTLYDVLLQKTDKENLYGEEMQKRGKG